MEKIHRVRVAPNLTRCRSGKVGVIGIVFKEMAHKPSVLDKHNQRIRGGLKDGTYACPHDVCFIEDLEGRVELFGALDVGRLFTGQVLGVIGELQDAAFKVLEVVHPGPPPQLRRAPPRASGRGRPRLLAIASGLQFGSNALPPLSRGLLIDWISGFLPLAEQGVDPADIVQVVIAGNSLTLDDIKEKEVDNISRERVDIPLGHDLKRLDAALAQLASSVPVALMPGRSDPGSFFIPQAPLHHCMFPNAIQSNRLRLVSNPFQFQIEDLTILGVAGQTTDSMKKFGRHSTLSALRASLESRSVAPNAPDSCGGAPTEKPSPLLLHSSPHVYFSANQAEFARETYVTPQKEEILLLSVPCFAKTQELVLLDLHTLETDIVNFS